jgi:hypothetical protein
LKKKMIQPITDPLSIIRYLLSCLLNVECGLSR